MHYYQRHIGDYAKDTGHLTLLEHGIYAVLLDWQYATERPLPEEQESIYRICRAATSNDKRMIDRVTNEFFPNNAGIDGGRFNKRAEIEIAEFRDLSKKNRNSAVERWRKERNAPALPPDSKGTATHEPLPIIHQPPDTGNDFPEVVTDEAVTAWAKTWPGEVTTGTPAISEPWLKLWLAKINGRANGWPRYWQRSLIADWRVAFKKSLAAGGSQNRENKKNAATETGGMSTPQALFKLNEALAEVKTRLDGSADLDLEPVQADVLLEKELVKKIAVLSVTENL